MSRSELISTIAHILEPWAFETTSWNATVARDDAMSKAEQIADALSPPASDAAVPAGPKHPLWHAAINLHDATPHLVGCHGKVSDSVNGWQPCSCYRHIRAMVAFAAAAPKVASEPDRYANDEAAKTLYDSWSGHPGWVPWVERGNSTMQERARREVML